jgi:hypothetical protein
MYQVNEKAVSLREIDALVFQRRVPIGLPSRGAPHRICLKKATKSLFDMTFIGLCLAGDEFRLVPE